MSSLPLFPGMSLKRQLSYEGSEDVRRSESNRSHISLSLPIPFVNIFSYRLAVKLILCLPLIGNIDVRDMSGQKI